jgi:hypothetical protein
VASNEKTGVPCSLFLSKIAVDTESVVVRIEETLSGQTPRHENTNMKFIY